MVATYNFSSVYIHAQLNTGVKEIQQLTDQILCVFTYYAGSLLIGLPATCFVCSYNFRQRFINVSDHKLG